MTNREIDAAVRKALGNPDAVSYMRLLEFARRVAQFKKDGETHDLGDGCPEPFDMASDDAVDTLHSCITEARDITGESPDTLVEGES